MRSIAFIKSSIPYGNTRVSGKWQGHGETGWNGFEEVLEDWGQGWRWSRSALSVERTQPRSKDGLMLQIPVPLIYILRTYMYIYTRRTHTHTYTWRKEAFPHTSRDRPRADMNKSWGWKLKAINAPRMRQQRGKDFMGF